MELFQALVAVNPGQFKVDENVARRDNCIFAEMGDCRLAIGKKQAMQWLVEFFHSHFEYFMIVRVIVDHDKKSFISHAIQNAVQLNFSFDA